MAKRKNGLFSWLTTPKVTYHRDVKKERAKLLKDARDSQRASQREQKEQARHDLAEIKATELAERKRKALRKKSDEVDRRIEKEMREQGLRNPPQSLKRGIKGTVKLVGKGKNARLLIYT